MCFEEKKTILFGMNDQAREYIAVAVDNCHRLSEIIELVEKTGKHAGVFKIGLEQYTRFGPEILKIVKDEGRAVFLDLKYHDIPNTVQKAVEAAGSYNVEYLTVHTQGGMNMLRAAVQGSRQAYFKPRIIGVTVLTSIDRNALNRELLVHSSTERHVAHLARLAVEAGLDGIVCSAADLSFVKNFIPDTFDIVTPGIRMKGNSADDQKRIATPQEAIGAGATLLVIGRPITEADDPGRAALRFETAVKKALDERGKLPKEPAN